MTRNIILAVAFLAFCSPAFAGDRGHSRGAVVVGGTSATSTSGSAVWGEKNATALAQGGNESGARAAAEPGSHSVAATSYGQTVGYSTGHGGFEAYQTGTSGAGTMGTFGTH